MRRYAVVGLLGIHALCWAAVAVQGVLLQISPKGTSLDAVLFGGVFFFFAAAAGWLANRVRIGDRRVTILITGTFALLGALGTLAGGAILIASTGATDSYVMPIGALSLVIGLIHLGGAAAAFGLTGAAES